MRTLILIFAALAAYGQTSVIDTLYSPIDGTAYAGTLRITAPSMTCSGVTYARSTSTVTPAAGFITLVLKANDACSVPAGEINGYKVVYAPTRGTGWTEWWIVPTSATAVTVGAIRTAGTPPVSPISILPQNIGLGGATIGQTLVATSVGWRPGTVVGGGGAGVWGGITGILADQADLAAELATKLTQAQARAAISGTSPIVYNQTTGAISCPTCGAGANAVSSVFGRTGDITALQSDYSSFYPILSGSYVNPSWLVSIPYTKITSPPTIPTVTSELTNDSGYLSDSGSYSNPSWLTALSVTKLTGITGTPNMTKFLRDDWTWQSVGAGSATWGQINGALADQTDLNSALAGKMATFTTGNSAQYFRGDLTLATFPTIPSATSQLTNDSGFLQSGGSYVNPTWLVSLPYTKITGHPVIPSSTSQLTNDSGFLQSSGSYANPTWLTSLAYAKLTGTPTIPTTTTQISEGTNQYFTTGRAQAAISGSAPISVAAGVVSCPTCIVTQYTLPTATGAVKGGIIVGSGLNIDGSGVLSTAAGGGNMLITTATSDPTGACTPGQAWVLRTDTEDPWICTASGTWRKVLSTLNVGGWQVEGTKGTAPGVPSTGNAVFWLDSTSLGLKVLDAGGTTSTTVRNEATRTANQFATHIDSNGVVQKAPIVLADLPDLSGTYSTKTASGDITGVLPNATVRGLNGTLLSGLATGLLKNTTSTGVPSIAVAADLPGHASRHQNGGNDEIATATAAANAIPKAGAGGTLAAAWIPTLNQSTTGNAATATALATNAGNCSAGSFPLGVDASGAVESCTAVTSIGVTAAQMPALTGDVTSTVGTVATTVGKINGVSLAGLATGILKNTTTTGAPSIAVAGDFPTLNQNTTGTAAGLSAQYIDWSASSGGTSIANKPTLGAMAAGAWPGSGIPNSTGSAWGTSYAVATAATADAIAQRNASGEVIAANTVATGKTPMATDTAVQSSQMPALTGDVTTSAGAVATTLAAKHKTNIASFTIFDPVSGDSGRVQTMFPYAVTITSVSCSVKAATSVSINLDERAFATPDTAGTAVLTSALVCDTNGETSTTFTNAGIAASVPMALTISAVSGTPDTLRVFVTYTID